MEVIEKIVERMSKVLEAEQLSYLKEVLSEEMEKQRAEDAKSNLVLLDDFIASKSYENCSEATLKLYKLENIKFLQWLQKSVIDTTKKDVERYLSEYKIAHSISNVTLNNMRRYVSAFFTYLEYEDIVKCNPVRKTKPIKEAKVIKEPFSELEMEEMKESVSNLRDRAIIETLYSTGVRVSELCKMNIGDLHGEAMVVKGKGNKERTVFFTEKALYAINKYLEQREDNSPALFVGLHKGCDRITKASVETMIRKNGRKNNIKAHPHKFRRTFASRALNKGMPIQEVQFLLGHTKIDTTMIYCKINEDNVKLSHARFVG